MKSTAALLSLLALPAAAWNAAPTAMTRGRVVKAANTDRRDVLRGAVAAVVLAGLQTTAGAAVAAEPSAADLKYKVLKKGDGPQPKIGDLVAIRFSGAYKGAEFDNILDTPEPLYWRVGSGTLVPGVELAVPQMHVGERWALTLDGELGFGSKGRRASVGKPSIPPNATLDFVLELVAIPGKEIDIIDLADVPDSL